MKLINCTPHTINIMDNDSNIILSIPASETLIRVSQTTKDAGIITADGIDIPITDNTFGMLWDYLHNKTELYLLFQRW